MKKLIALLLTFCMTLSLVACGANEKKPDNAGTETPQTQTQEQTAVSEDDGIKDEAWDELEALGNVKTENGVLMVTLTVPAELVGDDVTQESLEKDADGRYTSVKLNDDGSVTYKMTKKQHKAVMDETVAAFDEALTELAAEDGDTITKIAHNKDFTQFDITLDAEEIGLTEGMAALAFYMYGGIYGIFSGKTPDNIVVNYYNADGNLIQSTNSADLGQ